jgi:hypothetical protein
LYRWNALVQLWRPHWRKRAGPWLFRHTGTTLESGVGGTKQSVLKFGEPGVLAIMIVRSSGTDLHPRGRVVTGGAAATGAGRHGQGGVLQRRVLRVRG